MSAKSQRLARIEGEMQRVLSQLVAREVRDPRVGNVTITAVTVAPDLSTARVYFVPFGGKQPPDQVQLGLDRAAGFLRGAVGRALQLRHAPKLEFQFDEQIETADRLTRLIDRAVKADHVSSTTESDSAQMTEGDAVDQPDNGSAAASPEPTPHDPTAR